MSQPSAVAEGDLEKLFVTGNAQAKSYALSGMHKLNSGRFKELLDSLKGSNDKVQIQRGCIVSEQLLRDVIKDIDRGKYPY
jgi:hypothetical protein